MSASNGGGPGDPGALERLAERLREDAVIAPHVRDPSEPPVLGLLAAAGPRATGAPAEYTLLFEAIREGYLLHYGDPRLLDAADGDLRLLAGDYLYAVGLERLAGLDDLEAVRELGDLISLSARLHARDETDVLPALWLAAAVTVAAGSGDDHEAAKRALREGNADAAPLLAAAARDSAAEAGIDGALAVAAESIGFAAQDLPDRG